MAKPTGAHQPQADLSPQEENSRLSSFVSDRDVLVVLDKVQLFDQHSTTRHAWMGCKKMALFGTIAALARRYRFGESPHTTPFLSFYQTRGRSGGVAIESCGAVFSIKRPL